MNKDGTFIVNLDLVEYIKSIENGVDNDFREYFRGYNSRGILDFELNAGEVFKSDKGFKDVVKAGIKCSAGPIQLYDEDQKRMILIRSLNIGFDERKVIALHTMAYIVRRNVDLFYWESGIKSRETLARGYERASKNFANKISEKTSTIYDIMNWEFLNYFNMFLSSPVKPF